jgi:hypothetical protein
LFAFVKALHNRRPPWYEHGLVRKPLRKIGVVLLDDVEHRFLGEPAMVLGKQSVHGCKLFIGHGAKPERLKRTATPSAVVFLWNRFANFINQYARRVRP